MNASYTTIDGKNYSSLEIKTMTVKPVGNIAITKSPETVSLRGGEQATISVAVRNTRLAELRNVRVVDKLPSEIEVSGPLSKTIIIGQE